MNDHIEDNQGQDDFYPVLEALFAYNNDIESLDNFIYLATNVLGENWREDIYGRLEVYDPDTIQFAREKLEEVINFESARITWEEAVKIIENPDAQDLSEVAQRLDDFKYWLNYFGPEGEALFNDLSLVCGSAGVSEDIEDFGEAFDAAIQEEIGEDEYHNELTVPDEFGNFDVVAQEVETPNLPQKVETRSRINVFEHLPYPDQDYSYLENDIDDDVLWYFNNYILLMDYHERTLARIGARCVHLGGITLEQYPQFGYILDLLEEICETGDIILEHHELEPLIEARIKGGIVKFKRDLTDFKSELEKNATPDMIKDEENMSDIIDKLGGLAEEEEDKAGMGIDELINKLSSETGIGVSDKFEDDDIPPPPPPPEEKKKKRYFGKRPVKQPVAKHPVKQPVKKVLVKKPQGPAGGQPRPNKPSSQT